MRVAYICADAGVPVFGTKGCSVHVQEIIKQFLLRGDQLTLYALRSGGDNCLQAGRFQWREFPLGQAENTAARESLQLLAAQRIGSQLSEDKFDLVYERYSLWSHHAISRANQLGIPSILEVNAPLIEEQALHRELVNREQAQTVRDQVFLEATSIIAVSETVAQYVRDCLPESAHGKVHVVPNGVDTDRFNPEVSPQSPNHRFTVGFLGTLKPWHGIESLLAAFELVHKQLPEAMLRIIGDGPLRESLERETAKQRPTLAANIQWVGAVQPQHVPAHLAALDVAVAPYLSSPNFYFSPLKVYEYMATGRAIVASAIGQLQSVIEHEKTGLLYPPGDVAQMAEQIAYLCRHPHVARRLGMQARSVALEKHSWQHVLHTILAHLDCDRSTSATTIASCLASLPCEASL